MHFPSRSTLSALYLVNLIKNTNMNTKQNIGVGTCLIGILKLFLAAFSFHLLQIKKSKVSF